MISGKPSCKKKKKSFALFKWNVENLHVEFWAIKTNIYNSFLSNLFHNKYLETWQTGDNQTGCALSALKHFWSYCIIANIHYVRDQSTYWRKRDSIKSIISLLLFSICFVIVLTFLVTPQEHPSSSMLQRARAFLHFWTSLVHTVGVALSTVRITCSFLVRYASSELLLQRVQPKKRLSFMLYKRKVS